MKPQPTARRLVRHLWLAVRNRCPRCGRGAVARLPWHTRLRCEVCGHRFEREPGYYTGAMYLSYSFGAVITLPVWVPMLLAGVAVPWIACAVSAELIVAAPLLFLASRVVWMHLDCAFDPPHEAGEVLTP